MQARLSTCPRRLLQCVHGRACLALLCAVCFARTHAWGGAERKKEPESLLRLLLAPAGLCPQIQCYEYSPTSWCQSKRVCERAAGQRSNCFPKKRGRTPHWLKKRCPTMQCAQAQQLGYLPDFCTLGLLEGTCPQLKCFHYTDMGACRSGRACVCLQGLD